MAPSVHRPITVAGPSHARRFRVAIATGQIAKIRRPIKWQDMPAASMLHPYFLEADFSNRSEPALVFVPDFRIGNRSLVAPDEPDAFTKIDKSLILRKYDAEMRDRVLKRVGEIRAANPEARFAFWCLGWRELNNRTMGNHFTDGTYRHPVWNLADAESEVGDAVISLRSVLHHTMGRTLHIDASGHPSFVGLELFRRMAEDPAGDVSTHLDFLQENLSRPVVILPKDAVLTGDSVWLDALRLYVEKGLLRLHPGIIWKTVDELLEAPLTERRRAIYISGLRNAAHTAGDDVLEQDPADLRAVAKKGYRVSTYLWDARAREVLLPSLRRPAGHPSSLATLCAAVADALPNGSVIREAAASPPLVRASDVEVSHPSGPWPTLQGILGVVRSVGGMHRLEPFS